VRRGTRRSLALVLFLGAVAATNSCDPRTLDVAQLERRLGRELSSDLGVDGITAECPADIQVAEGQTFRCMAHSPLGKGTLAIDVTQIDDDGHVTWEIAGTAG
jgi:hypothetical protein